MAKRRRTGNRTFPRRSRLFLPFDTTIALITAGATVESGDMLGNYFGQTGEEVPVGTTLGPIRGVWAARPTVNTAFNENIAFEAVVQLNREGGRATLPVPGVDIIDAMWYGSLIVTEPGLEFGSGTFQQMPTVLPFETKAMRKVSGNGQTLTMTAVADQNTDYTLRLLGTVMLMLP